MTTKSQILVVVKMIDTIANPPIAKGRVTVAGANTGWKAILGRTPFVEFENELPKWSMTAVKDAVLGACGRANVPCEHRVTLVEP